jgi:hypothetical protein
MPARRPAAACGALLIALAVPAAADAATFTAPLKPCYVTAGTATNRQSEGFKVTGAGFGVNSTVNLAIDGQPVLGSDGNPLLNPTTGQPIGNNLQADDQGLLDVPGLVPAPWIKSGRRDFTVTLTDNVVPGNVATATAKTTALDVDVTPKRAKPSERVRFKGSGFTGAKRVFAHYVYGGKLKRTVRMARRTGVCGTWSARRPQIPVTKPKPGLWTVQFDQVRKYRNGTKGGLKSVYVRLGINVRLVHDG